MGSVSLKEHFEKLIELRFDEAEKAISLARELMEERLSGFPSLFVKKGDTDVQIAQLASDLKTINETLGEIKATQLPRKEFDMQHGMIMEKTNSQDKRIQTVEMVTADLKAITSEFNMHRQSIESRTQKVELLKAEITGKIWTLGILITILIFILEFITHFVLKSHGY